MMPMRMLTLALLPLSLASMPAAAARETSSGIGAKHAATAAEERGQPAQLPAAARLEQLVLEVYHAYETNVGRSGHDLRFRLSDFKTYYPADFDHSGWMELMTPPTGRRVTQWREYYDGPSLRAGQVVRYHLSWETVGERETKATRESLEILENASISRAITLHRTFWKNDLNPVAITSFRVDVNYAGEARSYRAAAFWSAENDRDRFQMTLEDHVVPEVESAVGERAAPVDHREMKQARTPLQRASGVNSVTGKSLAGSCKEETLHRTHHTIELKDEQGHKSGEHHLQLQLRASCHYGSDCYVQCEPGVAFKRCSENGTVSLYFGCSHTSSHDAQVSGDGTNNAAVKCGGALACGIKECCGLTCGGMSFTFTGSGGGLTATATSTGAGKVYNLSSNDSIECAAPSPVEDPCGSSTASGSGRATAALLIPCDDGGGTGGSGPGGTGDTRDPGSPILVDLDRSGLLLTSLEDGVRFDLDGDGELDRVAWTAADSGDAFLALDRNGNGRIDDGRELFGNFTIQPTAAEPNGFLALRVFDQAGEGGNADGRISADDAVYSKLRLWQDHNHDGVAQSGELAALSASGVVAIHLDYVDARRRDRHGNELRYSSLVRLRRATTQAVDVFFLLE